MGILRTSRLFAGLAVLTALVLAPPAGAVCATPNLITTINFGTGTYAYVINPTTPPGGLLGSTVTAALRGYFWGVGAGDPVVGVGIDNGAFPALDWMYIYPNYPASILTTWAVSADIDGCINDLPPASRCNAIFLEDLGTAGGAYWTVMTAGPSPAGDFFYDFGGTTIFMAEKVAPLVPATLRDVTTLTIDVDTSGLVAAGAYLTPAPECADGGGGPFLPVAGVRIRSAVVERGFPPPPNDDLASWPTVVPFAPFDVVTSYETECLENKDVYTAYTFVLDSDFEATYVSAPAGPFACGPCGNGQLDPGEACDDGNNADGDACPGDCLLGATCGNGMLEPGEACDDGNTADGDGCSAGCALEGACCSNGPGTESECSVTNEIDCLTDRGLYLGDGSSCSGDLDCVPLEVTLDSASATATRDGVLVRWTTAVEFDTVGFRVLRETAGGRVKAFGTAAEFVPARGNGLNGGRYAILDTAAEAARAVRYWIEDIDVFGRVTRHGPIAVERGQRQAAERRSR